MRFLVIPVLAIVASGCARTHRTLCEDRVRVTCEMAFRCCTPAEALFVLLGPDAAYVTSEGECFDRFAPACRAEDARDDGVAEGTLSFDQAAATACMDALTAARDACDLVAFRAAEEDTNASSGSCALVTTGNAANGEACTADEECGPRGFCRRDDAFNIEGVCVRPAELGEDCFATGCAEGLGCVDDGDEGRCELLPGDGAPCLDFRCLEGHECNAQQICEALPAIGESCDFNCASGAFCDDVDDETGLGTCAAVKAPGEACDGRLNECGSETCLNGRCTGNEEEGVCTGAL